MQLSFNSNLSLASFSVVEIGVVHIGAVMLLLVEALAVYGDCFCLCDDQKVLCCV